MRFGTWDDDDHAWLVALQTQSERAIQQRQTQTQSLAAEAGSADAVAGGGETTKIPRIIHQIWLGANEIPARCREWIQTWTQHHCGWEYRLWTDSDVAGFSLINQREFDQAANYGEKSDILRYEILAKYGGVYADVDMRCLAPFDCIIQGYSFVAGISNTGTVELNNGLIASVPQHPILLRLISHIQQQRPTARLDSSSLALIAQMSGMQLEIPRSLSANDTIERTGPGLFTKTFMLAIGWQPSNGLVSSRSRGFLTKKDKEQVVAFPPSVFYPLRNTTKDDPAKYSEQTFPPETMAVHYWERTWMRNVEESSGQ